MTVAAGVTRTGSAAVPATLTAAGSQTSPVLLPKTVSISATYHGITQSAKLIVGP